MQMVIGLWFFAITIHIEYYRIDLDRMIFSGIMTDYKLLWTGIVYVVLIGGISIHILDFWGRLPGFITSRVLGLCPRGSWDVTLGPQERSELMLRHIKRSPRG